MVGGIKKPKRFRVGTLEPTVNYTKIVNYNTYLFLKSHFIDDIAKYILQLMLYDNVCKIKYDNTIKKLDFTFNWMYIMCILFMICITSML